MVIKEFINKMQENTGTVDDRWSKEDCEFAIEAFTKAVIDCVADGEKVSIRNFGIFESLVADEREGINPKTMEKITIPAKKRPKFKPSKNFKNIVNGE